MQNQAALVIRMASFPFPFSKDYKGNHLSVFERLHDVWQDHTQRWSFWLVIGGGVISSVLLHL